MLSLMSLPSEVRAIIIQHVIASTRQCMCLDDVNSDRAEAPDMSYSSWTRECGIDYEVDARYFWSNCRGLLLTNRLLHAETKHEVRSNGAPSYEVDIMVTRYGELRPTWKCIPWITTKIKHLNMTFRVGCFSTFDMGLYYYPISRAWAIYSLIERFIALGPAAPGPPILDLEATLPRPTWQVERLVLSSVEISSPSRMPRRDFNDVLRTRFTEMTWSSLPTHTYAALLLCHIGSIEFRRGGQTMAVWYLEDLVQETDPGGYGRPRFRIKQGEGVKYGTYDEWRASILEVRRKKGLSTPHHLR